MAKTVGELKILTGSVRDSTFLLLKMSHNFLNKKFISTSALKPIAEAFKFFYIYRW